MLPVNILAQDAQTSAPETSYSIEYSEPSNPEIVHIEDPATIQVYNEIIALRPAIKNTFARAHFKIAEDDLDEYQCALRRIEQTE